MGLAGLWPAARLSLVTGLLSTALALAVTLLILAGLRGSRAFRALVRLLSPLLSVPHAAAALGLAFLIAPSGWIARALSPWATGWTAPPDILVLNDPAGMALTFGLVAKEVPFLLLMALAALPQTDAARRITLAETLGYSRAMAFALTVLPALYRQLRLPTYAVLAYGMTDGRHGADPGADAAAHAVGADHPVDDGPEPGAAAAGLGRGPGATGAGRGRAGAVAGRRGGGARGAAVAGPPRPPRAAGRCGGAATGAAGGGAGGCRAAGGAGRAGAVVGGGAVEFPDALPREITLRTWMQAGDGLWAATATTAALGGATAALALALTLGCLEAEHRHRLAPGRALLLLWVPLLVPQIAFLPGLQTLALTSGAGGWLATLAAHLTFALPYAFLSLAPAFHAFDPRIAPLAASLGASDNRIFWRLRLPMLLRPVLTAGAVAFAVSVGQYLPTLLIGGGRIETLTTEAVALSSGGNRRVIGAYALLQMALPALAFALAFALPALAFRNRREMAA